MDAEAWERPQQVGHQRETLISHKGGSGPRTSAPEMTRSGGMSRVPSRRPSPNTDLWRLLLSLVLPEPPTSTTRQEVVGIHYSKEDQGEGAPITVIQGAGVAGACITTCFPSIAPMQLGKFQRHSNCPAVVSQSSLMGTGINSSRWPPAQSPILWKCPHDS